MLGVGFTSEMYEDILRKIQDKKILAAIVSPHVRGIGIAIFLLYLAIYVMLKKDIQITIQ